MRLSRLFARGAVLASKASRAMSFLLQIDRPTWPAQLKPAQQR